MSYVAFYMTKKRKKANLELSIMIKGLDKTKYIFLLGTNLTLGNQELKST